MLYGAVSLGLHRLTSLCNNILAPFKVIIGIHWPAI